MSLKARLQNKLAGYLFSAERRDKKRAKLERQRQSRNQPHLVEYFHEASDPYSHLMAQILPEFCRRYDVDLKVHIVSPPPDWAAPDRQRLVSYARLDSQRLADRAGLSFVDPGKQPDAARLARANANLVEAVKDGAFISRAAEIGHQFWTGEASSPQPDETGILSNVLAGAADERDEKGHYLGATVYYAGEWYWGVDRLHHLERRLIELGAAHDSALAPIFAPPEISSQHVEAAADGPELHWYLSFRSPYTGIVAERVKALADAYGADLKLRFVLPMVMRGMQVPRTKGFYIMSDTVREAERQGIPFGNMFDPVGRPVERGYGILHKAIELGQGYAFARSFLSGVWADGIDAGTDRGMQKIVERAGLNWAEMKPLMGGDHWRADADANQEEMFAHGVWGVPSFRVGTVTAWGQDRLWVIEDALKETRQSTAKH